MPKYVLAYHGGGMPETEAEQAQVMEAWGAWFGQLGDAVLDGGNPIGQARTVSSGGAVTEGGGAGAITGYSLIQADDIDGAVKLASGCPILDAGGTVQVGETVDM